MLTAVGASALFLVFYVTRAALTGTHEFAGEGLVHVGPSEVEGLRVAPPHRVFDGDGDLVSAHVSPIRRGDEDQSE